MITVTKMTATEYLQGQETSQPMHLIEGEIVVMPTPKSVHQRIVKLVLRLLESHTPNGEVFIAPLDVIFDDKTVLQPDVFWVAEGGLCDPSGPYPKGAPDLIVEIISPGSIRLDRKIKFGLYEKFGVREYWMLTPEENLAEVWTRRDDKFALIGVYDASETFESPLLGSIEVRALFPAVDAAP
ncbi:MAG: Uma2 family endonuclease [Blastochloris sp.]|nr:Uma2 family endonuclease [Blastochloris sp.]